MRKISLFFVLISSFFSSQTLEEIMHLHEKTLSYTRDSFVSQLKVSLKTQNEAKKWMIDFIPMYIEMAGKDNVIRYLVSQSTLPETQKTAFYDRIKLKKVDNLLAKRIEQLKNFSIDFDEWRKDSIENNIVGIYDESIIYKVFFEELENKKDFSEAEKQVHTHLEYAKFMEKLKAIDSIKPRLTGQYHQSKLYQLEIVRQFVEDTYKRITAKK